MQCFLFFEKMQVLLLQPEFSKARCVCSRVFKVERCCCSNAALGYFSDAVFEHTYPDETVENAVAHSAFAAQRSVIISIILSFSLVQQTGSKPVNFTTFDSKRGQFRVLI